MSVMAKCLLFHDHYGGPEPPFNVSLDQRIRHEWLERRSVLHRRPSRNNASMGDQQIRGTYSQGRHIPRPLRSRLGAAEDAVRNTPIGPWFLAGSSNPGFVGLGVTAALRKVPDVTSVETARRRCGTHRSRQITLGSAGKPMFQCSCVSSARIRTCRRCGLAIHTVAVLASREIVATYEVREGTMTQTSAGP